MKKYLLTVVGPTAVGKTKLAIALAHHFRSEIISADSRQLYKEMEIGTAKPTAEELACVKHYFINSHSIFTNVSAGKYEKEVLALTERLFLNNNYLIMAGGSGLYVDAVAKGFAEIPHIEPAVRERLNESLEEEGLEKLVEQLMNTDPVYAVEVDKNNPQRVIRALEVFIGTGVPYSQWRKPPVSDRKFEVIKVGLELPRDQLYERINDRMDNMIEEGLFEEAKSLYRYRHINALQTVGYKEIFDYMSGRYDKEECIRLLKRNSRRYAKRQLTWFKKDTNTRWFSPENIPGILDYVKQMTN
ncbi:tRNA (adenosine(37)-N6)-dimethylallyltransferase MiaA [Fulvivirga sp. M361]|uniref:tRNA (adenosine(37)-N6)-dimethylallyltransferase MiaA n=1 Tax=Fulvivirga sp. M361 TaxID=2594266 RepID=UPI00117AB25B|nr:tRNA (adenosine(37)-N6)-dimethylallyltransferase MiaA [Fulvivirga sp. M361]TRX62182.1 tRNA (adenosine(37)-N6)-dimethylallyltransferase MiaA [Fulvivirga sp. M361]